MAAIKLPNAKSMSAVEKLKPKNLRLTDMGLMACDSDSDPLGRREYVTVIGWECPFCGLKCSARSQTPVNLTAHHAQTTDRMMNDMAVAMASVANHDCEVAKPVPGARKIADLGQVDFKSGDGHYRLATLDLLNELGNRELSGGEKQALGSLCVKFGAGVQNWLMHWAKKLMGKSVFSESEWEEMVKELLAPGYSTAPSNAVWVRAEMFDDVAKERDALAEKYKLALEKLAHPLTVVPASVSRPEDVAELKRLYPGMFYGKKPVEAAPENAGATPTHYVQSQDCRERGGSAANEAVAAQKLRHEAERAEKNRIDWLDEDLVAADVEPSR